MTPPRLVFFLLFLFGAGIAFAQQNNLADSLKKRYELVESDTARIRLLNKISEALRVSNPAEALGYAEQELKLAISTGDEKRIAEAHLSNGSCLAFLSDYQRELDHYLKALPIFEKLNDVKGLGNTYNLLGSLYYNLDNVREALKYYKFGYEYRKKLGNPRGVSSSLNNVGLAYLDLGVYDSAMTLFDEALALNRESGNRLWEAVNLHNIGQIYYYQNNDSLAYRFFREALTIRTQLGNSSGIISGHYSLGNVHERKKEFSEAILHYDSSYAVAVKVSSMHYIRKNSKSLAVCYDSVRNEPEALYWYKKYVRADDSLNADKTSSLVAVAIANHELNRMQENLKLEQRNRDLEQEAELNRQKLINYYIIGGAILLIIIAFFLYYRYRLKRRTANELEVKVQERTEALERSNQQLNTFIYQSSHDLRSPLTSIRGLVDVALGDPKDSSRYLGLIKDRVEHLDGVYSNLIHAMNIRSRTPSFTRIRWSDLENEALAEVTKVRGNHPVVILSDITNDRPFHTDSFLAVQVLRSLLLNVVDFRSSENPSAHIYISVEQKQAVIRVTDNGEGIPAEIHSNLYDMFFRGSNRSRGSGLGLFIVKEALSRLGGMVSLESAPGKGSVFTVIIPEA